MTAEELLNIMKTTHSHLLTFIDCEDNIEENFQNLIRIFDDEKILSNQHYLKLLLHMIARIADDHHRTSYFFEKIEKILNIVQWDLPKSEIFEIFKSNKRILLYLIEEKIINFDNSISAKMKKTKYKDSNYLQYFYPEIKEFLSETDLKEFELPDNFDVKRKIGENDDQICQLIRKDSLEDFIEYVKTNNVLLNSNIKPSIFETNSFLINKNPTLIEYAVFFKANQIFNYLKSQNIELTTSLWMYAIHSENAEIIQLLDDNYIEPTNTDYNAVLYESIKCHNIEITNYIIKYYFEDEKEYNDVIPSYCISYYNPAFMDKNMSYLVFMYHLCRYDYYSLVEMLLKDSDINVNEPEIQ